MDFLEINTLLNRNSIVKEIEEFLNNFEKNKYNVLIKRGIYIYGPPGSGKTFFIKAYRYFCQEFFKPDYISKHFSHWRRNKMRDSLEDEIKEMYKHFYY